MVKTILGKRRGRAKKFKGDPIADQLVMASAKNLLITNVISMGLRLALTILLPIFAGVQLDKRFDSAPSLTLAAFFIAIFGASLLIYKTYVEMTAEIAASDKTKTKRIRKAKRTNDA